MDRWPDAIRALAELIEADEIQFDETVGISLLNPCWTSVVQIFCCVLSCSGQASLLQQSACLMMLPPVNLTFAFV
jgi:hypothetical protein